jgi:hypothetical protein
MKAISLWQPWASLMVIGLKKNETRSWATKYRGLLAIHASKKVVPFKDAFGHLPVTLQKFLMDRIVEHYGCYSNLPTGAVLGTVNVKGCVDTEFGRFVSGETELACGDYTDGRFAWLTDDSFKFDKPIPAKGMQGFWNWDGEVLGDE